MNQGGGINPPCNPLPQIRPCSLIHRNSAGKSSKNPQINQNKIYEKKKEKYPRIFLPHLEDAYCDHLSFQRLAHIS